MLHIATVPFVHCGNDSCYHNILLSDSFREAFNEQSLLKLIIPYLSSPESAVQLQALRIIGNLCYENGENHMKKCI